MFVLQVLQSWMNTLPNGCTVNDFVNEIQEWIGEGYIETIYVDTSYVDILIWQRLKKYVAPDVLPNVTEKKRTEALSPIGGSSRRTPVSSPTVAKGKK